MIKNKSVEVLKQGVEMPEHECKWVMDELNPNAPDGVYDFQRICRICGRVEHVIQVQVSGESFKDVYNKFHEVK